MLRYASSWPGDGSERQKIELLIATRQREEQGIKARADAVKNANDMTLNFLNTVIVQGKSANQSSSSCWDRCCRPSPPEAGLCQCSGHQGWHLGRAIGSAWGSSRPPPPWQPRCPGHGRRRRPGGRRPSPRSTSTSPAPPATRRCGRWWRKACRQACASTRPTSCPRNPPGQRRPTGAAQMISFPVPLADFWNLLPIKQMTFDAPPPQNFARTLGGEAWNTDIGDALWTGTITLDVMTEAERRMLEPLLDVLRPGGRHLLARDRACRPAPAPIRRAMCWALPPPASPACPMRGNGAGGPACGLSAAAQRLSVLRPPRRRRCLHQVVDALVEASSQAQPRFSR